MKYVSVNTNTVSPRAVWRSRLYIRVFVIILVPIITAFGAFDYYYLYKDDLKLFAIQHGYGAVSKSKQVWDVLNIPHISNLFFSDLPVISLDIKFKHLEKLYRKRDAAFKKGRLIQSIDDFVPAKVAFSGKKYKAKIRLKGDYPDHLIGKKWSFRVHVKQAGHVLGMRRFSLQNPETRGFQAELLFHKILESLGVVATRYHFVDAYINGTSIGIMALEEHFSKELLEHYEKKESVIIRYDESDVWASDDGMVNGGFRGVYDDYRNAEIDSFRTSRISTSADLQRQEIAAVGLLKSFTEGTLPASEIFNADVLAQYLAAAELFGAWHDLTWNNMRFYLNPYLLKLEPIGYDSSLNHRRDPQRSACGGHYHCRQMLKDPAIYEKFVSSLKKLIKKAESGEIQRMVKKEENKVFASLQSEFFLLDRYPLDELKERAEHVLNTMEKSLNLQATVEGGRRFDERNDYDSRRYPVLLRASRLDGSSEGVLSIKNAVPRKILITDISWVSSSGEKIPFTAKSDFSLPISLAPRVQQFSLTKIDVPYSTPELTGEFKLVMKVEVKGGDDSRQIVVPVRPRAFEASPLSMPAIASQFNKNPFLYLCSEGEKAICVKKGEWIVTDGIYIPGGYELHVAAGTSLLFPEDGKLISYGPIYIEGNEFSRVHLENQPGEKSWQGIAILTAPKESQWAFADIRNTSGIETKHWKLTGGVNFYMSDVKISNVNISGSLSEDALNIVHAKINFSELYVENSLSDGLDGDFIAGVITNSHFNRIGLNGEGDAIDLSGSDISITGTIINNVGDKGISAGEKSVIRVDKVEIMNSGIGIASKDRSSLSIRGSHIDSSKIAGMMAYTKKPIYGPASLEATDTRVTNTETPAIAQVNSVISVDGVVIEPRSVDVDAIYSKQLRLN